MEGPLKSRAVRRYSRAGRHHASFIKLINSLIAFTILGIIGFAMLPSFLLPNLRSASAAKGLNSNVQPNRLSAIKKKRDCNMTNRSNIDLSAVSGVTRTAALHNYKSGVKHHMPGGKAFLIARTNSNFR